jgi:hypothetical protein
MDIKRNIKISPFFMKESANGSYGLFPFSVESPKSNVVISAIMESESAAHSVVAPFSCVFTHHFALDGIADLLLSI